MAAIESEGRLRVERSPFVCVATSRPGLDVSPRGDQRNARDARREGLYSPR